MLSCKYTASTERDAGADDPIADGLSACLPTGGMVSYFFITFAKRLTVSGKPITCEVLDFFDRWRTSQEAITHFAYYTQRSVRSALAQLVELWAAASGRTHRKLKQDSRIAKEWSALAARRKLPFFYEGRALRGPQQLEP